MALIDTASNALVLRIVYDGPPVAGKTASVRSLARILGGDVTSPETAGERTLWYDWMAYLGGRFEGRPILCQTVTVPGQAGLVARRRAILAESDAVVFVADTTETGLERSVRAYAEMRAHLAVQAPPAPVVVQANKRDQQGAVPLDEVTARLGAGPVGDGAPVIGTSAVSGDGVRQAFVYAVRLALRRVTELAARGRLPAGAATTPAELLECLRELDRLEPEPRRPQGSQETGAAARPAAAGPTFDEEQLATLLELLHHRGRWSRSGPGRRVGGDRTGDTGDQERGSGE